MTRDEIVIDWLTLVANDFNSNMDSKGLTATGKTKQQTEVVKTDSGGQVLVAKSVGALVNGRRPNTNQSPEVLRAWVGWAGSTFLKEWVDAKGIDRNSYAVAWGVARKGWQIPNNHNDGRLFIDTITDEKVKKLLSDLGNFYITETFSNIDKAWQQ